MKLTDMIKLGVKGFKPSDIKQINESGIPTDEVIKLAESGYSISDVNELISLADKETGVQPGNNDAPDQHEPADETSGNKGDDAGIENNRKLEAQEAEIEKLKAQLQNAQQKNTTQNLGPAKPVTNEAKVQELFRQLY